jgi:hypothetical protein
MFIPPSPRYLGLSTSDVTYTLKENVAMFRDTLRNGWRTIPSLNQALPSPRWKVSDIGSTSHTPSRGYYFVVRDTLKNNEYLFIFPGEESANNIGEMTDYWGTTGDWVSYVQPVGTDADPSGTGQGTIDIIVYQNPDYATSSMARSFGFDDTTELTYTTGDFEQVTTDPITTSAVTTSWLPVGGVKYVKGFSFRVDGERTAYAVMFDDVEDSVWMWGMRSAAISHIQVDSMCVLSKRLFVVNDSADTYLQGGAWWEIRDLTAELLPHLHARALGFDDAGNAITDFTLIYRQLYSFPARKDGSEYRWRNIPVVSPSYDKGWLREVHAREMGASQSYVSTGWTDVKELFQAPSAGLPQAKFTGDQASAWATDLPALPFSFTGWGRVDGLLAGSRFTEDGTYIVPGDASRLSIFLQGGGGGGGRSETGGAGGWVQAIIDVNGGESLTVVVGTGGGDGGASGVATGGVPGGGDGSGSPTYRGGGGGGYTAVLRGATILAIAGGGGGAGSNAVGDAAGGDGGNPGGDGNDATGGTEGGHGATTGAGGAAGTGTHNGTAGTSLQGGDGHTNAATTPDGGGGGGGGYYGGGGGGSDADDGGGGGGGSSYVPDPTATNILYVSGSAGTAGGSNKRHHSGTLGDGGGNGVFGKAGIAILVWY